MTPFVSLPRIIVSIDLRRFLRGGFFWPASWAIDFTLRVWKEWPRDHKFDDCKLNPRSVNLKMRWMNFSSQSSWILSNNTVPEIKGRPILVVNITLRKNLRGQEIWRRVKIHLSKVEVHKLVITWPFFQTTERNQWSVKGAKNPS